MIITAGELLAEFVSKSLGCGLRRQAEFEGPFPSGAPAIFIDQAARMGAKTRIYGGVGQDGFGEVVVERLSSHGVDCTTVARTEGVTTGVAFVSYYPDGSRTFIYHIDHSAAETFETRPLPEGAPPIYHISGAALGNPVLRGKLIALADDVLAAGGRITFDPNIRPELFREKAAWQAVDKLLDACWMALPSEADIAALYPGVAMAEAIGRLHDRGAEIVALKKARPDRRSRTARR
jgi:sugar/nucleoside kinase (ribokinase family)